MHTNSSQWLTMRFRFSNGNVTIRNSFHTDFLKEAQVAFTDNFKDVLDHNNFEVGSKKPLGKHCDGVSNVTFSLFQSIVKLNSQALLFVGSKPDLHFHSTLLEHYSDLKNPKKAIKWSTSYATFYRATYGFWPLLVLAEGVSTRLVGEKTKVGRLGIVIGLD